MRTGTSVASTSGYVASALGYRHYVLGVLILVGTFAWIDRQLLAILLQSIKTDFRLTDTQLGLIGGTAFGLFYVTAGLPVAWLADRSNRRTVIAGSMALWSILTSLCGLTNGFWTLFLARIGVGIGEAGAAAPSQSILSDYFPARQRGLVLGLLYSYVPLSYLLSYGLGGWLNETIGWRLAFVVFGIPGVAVAALVHLTIREPARGAADPGTPPPHEAGIGFGESLRYVASRPTLRRLPFAGAAHALGMVAAAVWMPTYFIRTYHMSSAAVGLRLALLLGLGGLVGTLGGGQLADFLARTRDVRWYAWSCAIAVLITVPFTLAVYVVHSASLALALFVVPCILNHMLLGPTFAAVQNVSDSRHRAMAAACYLFFVNLLSMGLGPLLVGLVSDLLQARYGLDGLRYSLMLLISCASTTAGLCYLYAAPAVKLDLGRAPTAAGLTS